MYKTLKRWIDIVASLSGIILLSPILIFIALWIKMDSKGPVLFTQKRIGIHKSTFPIYKFRTMRTDTPQDTPTHLLEDPMRFITKSGAFLRRSSLDELPQLFNILLGQMSVVGPRPALWNQDDLIAERDKYGANDIRPGLTGWAQINGRDELEIDVKAKLDGEYVEKMNLLLDAKIFVKTFFSALKSEGVKEGTGEKKEN
ncbi:MAG: capsular biosynthesis protein [Firmicutes bacterium GWF2_51_9]|nr:sugar transferase [Erysipelotrichaceae bacterium]OGS55045.1 MAG: capsular biosynthesis protein [Firmicutes bacterium GWF2_51_9]OGS58343.1 MAG: capsular biosynthesis protein [Firmicutes bacterium GWE2_51_13]HAM64180.1 lipid carrier--UDP-N-acetylgalactosaminyltransferase [Erysipelotrichaceae bacterium]HAO61609.1 lipid carrier--UDP-N-acetylgalactosaminyltransferase [Erysipelotrichaceae bacterium]